MLKKLPKSISGRQTLRAAVKWIFLAEVAAAGWAYSVWRKMCRQQGLLNFFQLVTIKNV